MNVNENQLHKFTAASSSQLKIFRTQKGKQDGNNEVQCKMAINEILLSLQVPFNFKRVKLSAKAENIYGRNAINKKEKKKKKLASSHCSS